MAIKGFDISYAQGTIPISSYLAQGAGLIIAKATQSDFVDGRWHSNKTQMQAVDTKIVKGAYHFLTDMGGAAQCDNFLAAVGGLGEGWICALDLEAHKPTSSDSRHTYYPQQALDFIDRWNTQAPGHPLAIYTNIGGVGAATRNGAKPWPATLASKANTYLWLAWPTVEVHGKLQAYDVSGLRYTATGQWKLSTHEWAAFQGFTTAKIIQFATSDVRVGGDRVDGDATNLSRQGLLALTTAGSVPVDPPPPAGTGDPIPVDPCAAAA